MSDLHAHVEFLFPGDKRRIVRILVHALIDLGQITRIECSWDKCVIPGVPLDPAGIRRACATLDHTLAIANGGTDDWRNITLMHHTCNMRKAKLFTNEHRAALSETMRARWQNDEYRTRVIENVTEAIRAQHVRAQKSAAMKRHWADPERRTKHAAAIASGRRWKKE